MLKYTVKSSDERGQTARDQRIRLFKHALVFYVLRFILKASHLLQPQPIFKKWKEGHPASRVLDSYPSGSTALFRPVETAFFVQRSSRRRRRGRARPRRLPADADVDRAASSLCTPADADADGAAPVRTSNANAVDVHCTRAMPSDDPVDEAGRGRLG